MKLFCLALVLLAALAIGDAWLFKRRAANKLTRGFVPIAGRVARAAQTGASGKRNAVGNAKRKAGTPEEEAAEFLVGAAILDEILPDKKKRSLLDHFQSRAAPAIKAFKKRAAARALKRRGTDEEAAEALVGAAILGEVLSKKKRSFVSHFQRKAAPAVKVFKKRFAARALKRRGTEEDAAEALVGLAVLDAALSEDKKRDTDEDLGEALVGAAILDEILSKKKKRADSTEEKSDEKRGVGSLVNFFQRRAAPALKAFKKRAAELNKRNAKRSVKRLFKFM